MVIHNLKGRRSSGHDGHTDEKILAYPAGDVRQLGAPEDVHLDSNLHNDPEVCLRKLS